jgi:hypothetical protein
MVAPNLPRTCQLWPTTPAGAPSQRGPLNPELLLIVIQSHPTYLAADDLRREALHRLDGARTQEERETLLEVIREATRVQGQVALEARLRWPWRATR